MRNVKDDDKDIPLVTANLSSIIERKRSSTTLFSAVINIRREENRGLNFKIDL